MRHAGGARPEVREVLIDHGGLGDEREDAHRARLAAHGGTPSMSRRGDCFDHAVVESFFATLKVELVHDTDWADHRTARHELFEFIEVWYNRQRRHSTLGYLSPAAYEESPGMRANAA